jgi:acetyl-CoA carboxylase/biotin carboxylase 1
MKKLALANPELTYPERKEHMEKFLPDHIRSESEIAEYFENGEDVIAAYIQQVKDQACANQIYRWA